MSPVLLSLFETSEGNKLRLGYTSRHEHSTAGILLLFVYYPLPESKRSAKLRRLDLIHLNIEGRDIY
jgi:hypothetical protein